ncbi:MAG: hypothetical protein M0T70_07295 [Geobacteraceae bacterium]|nr:hypothetical protein [Geobacteraceae bacterium]
MGVNLDSSASSSVASEEIPPDKTTFRFRVVEHLSWDNYDEESRTFRLGHKDNKPIVGRKFKIKMPDGSVREETTNADGVIELVEQDGVAKFEVIFEPETAALNNRYVLFYNKTVVVDTEL